MSSVSGYTFHQFPFFMGYWRLAIGRHAMLPCCPSCPLAESSDVMASYTWRTQRPVNVMKKTRQRCFHWMVWWWLYMTLWWFKQLKWRYPWGYWRDTPSGIKHGEIHNLRWENHRKSSLLLGFFQHVLAARGLFFLSHETYGFTAKSGDSMSLPTTASKKTWLDEVGCTGGLLCLGTEILVTSRSCWEWAAMRFLWSHTIGASIVFRTFSAFDRWKCWKMLKDVESKWEWESILRKRGSTMFDTQSWCTINNETKKHSLSTRTTSLHELAAFGSFIFSVG